MPTNRASSGGRTTEPSGCWWFSRIATSQRVGGQSAVEGGCDLRLSVVVAVADREAPGLEGGAVGGGGELAVGVLRGHHASQSNLRDADEPRSPPATSITRYGTSIAASISVPSRASLRCSASASSGFAM